jgi:hypothetical protein
VGSYSDGMPDFDQVTRTHALQAVAEGDRLGRDAFLDKYGFKAGKGVRPPPRRSRLRLEAILGVAYRYASGTPLTSDAFSGGKDGAAKVLVNLGFDVLAPIAQRPEAVSASAVGSEHARSTWALAARGRLIEAAKVCHSVVTYKELAELVQEHSLIYTAVALFTFPQQVHVVLATAG